MNRRSQATAIFIFRKHEKRAMSCSIHFFIYNSECKRIRTFLENRVVHITACNAWVWPVSRIILEKLRAS